MFDVMVIGAGPGGYEAAIRAAQNGLKVLLVEKDCVGGTCLNRGCIPTKALLHAAHGYESVHLLESYGIKAEGLTFDLEALYQKKEEIVKNLRQGIEQLIKQNKIVFVKGEAKIRDGQHIEVDGVPYEGKQVLIACGSKPAMPPIPGLQLPGVMSSDELLQKPFSGKTLGILGGGVIGVELASVYLAFGVQVIIIEALDRLLPLMDKELGQSVQMKLKRQNAVIHTNTRLTQVQQAENGLKLILDNGKEALCDGLLVSVGRQANTRDLFLEGVPMPPMEKGRILVSENFETGLPGIFAIGDASSPIQLAHAASAQGLAVADALVHHKQSPRLDLIPSCVYLSPEIASVGLTEEQAKEKGIQARACKYLMAGNGRTQIAQSGRGFIKLVFNEENDCLIGAQLMCERAGEMISEAALAIANGLSAKDLIASVRPHPSFCEGFSEATEAYFGKAIHMAPKA